MSGEPTLIVSYSGVLGGAERILLDCATRLRTPVLLACPVGPLATAAKEAGLAHAPVPERSLRLRGARIAHARAAAAVARDVAALSRRHRPRAVGAWGARAVLAAGVIPRRPPVLAVHMDLLPSGGVALAVRAATRRAQGVAAASEAIAEAVGGGIVLHPGVDLAAWTPEPPPAPNPPRALVLGALVPWKRPDLALEVAARIPALQLELAGAPIPGDAQEFEVRLRERAAQPDLAGRVTFLGSLPDPRPALARAHCLLHCADAEPWGLALVEALAAGRPVVAADAAGPREIVADGAGRRFPPGDAAAAAAALQAVLADPAAPAAARARAEMFPVAASAARFEAALEAVAR
ncbi:MAG TPA: glycosyltransferase [Solirubrobacteraceae bacterium]|nr:glycosyltransferase [Solirubrobacteraceae bacterium]